MARDDTPAYYLPEPPQQAYGANLAGNQYQHYPQPGMNYNPPPNYPPPHSMPPHPHLNPNMTGGQPWAPREPHRGQDNFDYKLSAGGPQASGGTCICLSRSMCLPVYLLCGCLGATLCCLCS